MTDEEKKQMCLADLEESYNYIDDILCLDTPYNIKNGDEIQELSWSKYAYSKLYERVESSNSKYFEEPIGEFQSDMLEFSRRNKLTSRMFMYMFNVAAEFLEYLYVMINDEEEYRKEN